MAWRIESIDIRVRQMPPDRMSFVIGKAGPSGDKGKAAKRRPRAILINRVTLRDPQGNIVHGWSGDRPSFGWLDKRPKRSPEDKLNGLLRLVGQSRELFLSAGESFTDPFSLWLEVGQAVHQAGAKSGEESLACSYATALMERAILDAVCRAEGLSFFQAVKRERLGIRPGLVHPALKETRIPDLLPARPRTRFAIRHTVGLADPLTDEDIPAGSRVNDGEPESLAAYARRDGLRYFKVKISGDADTDLERLAAIWNRVVSRIDNAVITLDGNEAYTDLEAFIRFVERFERNLTGLFQHTLFIEQPLTRALTHDPATQSAIQRLAQMKPLVIDEADGTITSFREAFALGYDGVSHKNCKGVFKSMLNLALSRHFFETTGRQAFLSGEDLSNMPMIPLHQDFASLGVLDIPHCERNGHHYAFGLSHLTKNEKGTLLKRHPDLYVQRGEEVFLNIRNGTVETATLQGPGFGGPSLPDWDSLQSLPEWIQAQA